MIIEPEDLVDRGNNEVSINHLNSFAGPINI